MFQITLKPNHDTFLGRYLFFIFLFVVASFILGKYANIGVLDFTYTAPMLSAWASGMHFYRRHSISPIQLFYCFGTLGFVILINACFFAFLWVMFVTEHQNINITTVFLTQQAFACLGIVLSLFYYKQKLKADARHQK